MLPGTIILCALGAMDPSLTWILVGTSLCFISCSIAEYYRVCRMLRLEERHAVPHPLVIAWGNAWATTVVGG